MERALNDLENVAFAVGQPFNIAAMMKLKGSLSVDLVKSTLVKLQKKHPLLKVRIVFNEKDNPILTSNGVREIPLTIINRENDSQVKQEFDRQLITPFDFNNETLPLFRVVLFTSPEISEIIFCSLHIISDGLSMSFLSVDFVNHYIAPNLPIEPIDLPAKDVDLLPKNVRRMIPKTPLFSFFVYIAFSVYNFCRYAFTGKAKNPKINLQENELDIITWKLAPNLTAQFLERCKKEQVTVHSALCTAFLPENPIIGSPVNIRKRLRIPVGKAFGFYSSIIVLTSKYLSRLSFWENARKLQKKLIRQLRDRTLFLPQRIISKKASYTFLRKLGTLYVEVFTNKNPFSVNNLGSLDKLTQEVDLAKFPLIEAFYGGITSFLDASIILVYTLNQQMHFHYHYPKFKYSLEDIENQIENAKNRLFAALK